MGFTRSNGDWSVYHRPTIDRCGEAFLVAYVDDMLISSPSRSATAQIKQDLAKKWRMTDLGEAKFVLGLRITRDQSRGTITLSQEAYIDTLLEKFDMVDAAPVSTPAEAGKKLEPEGEACKAGTTAYQALVGCLMWTSLCTRPDITYAVAALSRFNASPTEAHWKAGKRVLRYLKGTKALGLELGGPKSSLNLEGWIDADYGGDLEKRRSTTGYAMSFCGGIVSWSSRLQKTIATSTTEAEYMALTEGAKEVAWLRAMARDLGVRLDGPVQLWGDNQSALKLAENPGFYRRTKHIDIQWHFIRQEVAEGRVRLDYIATANQRADILTKGLARPAHERLADALGVRSTA